MRKERAPYEFSPGVRNQVLREQKRRCAVTGEKRHYLEIHHMLPIAVATGFWPNINPDILKQRENAVALTPQAHTQLHNEMNQWPKEFFRSFVVGLFSYLRDQNEAAEQLRDENRLVQMELELANKDETYAMAAGY